MKYTEEIKPFSTIGKPGKFDVDKANIYLKGLNQLIFNTSDSYKEILLKKERSKIIEQIAYYEENKTAYSL